jgi:hypothetical protein
MKDLTIASIEALPVSVPLRQAVTQGLGSVTKRDTVTRTTCAPTRSPTAPPGTERGRRPAGQSFRRRPPIP